MRTAGKAGADQEKVGRKLGNRANNFKFEPLKMNNGNTTLPALRSGTDQSVIL
ncbi:hypothetical protein D3C73_719130 [compost metagenome]